jgi:hypothetical protein
MKHLAIALLGALGLVANNALAWSNHTLPSYRAFETMPEVANAAPVRVETLAAFLKAQEKSIEVLLANQEAWAQHHLDAYPPRPAALAFKSDPARTDEALQQAFLRALRVAPNSKMALFLQPDPWQTKPDAAALLPHDAVSTLPAGADSNYRFVGLQAGDQTSALAVLATATDEPDYGLDINLWGENPSEWGKVYAFGTQSFGASAISFATQAPFHMGFFHEDRIIYLAAPFVKRTFPLLRVHQFSTLAALAFNTGHAYWGWRFTGMALHYVQDLTQPFHANLAPGNASIKLIGINLLAMVGLPRMKDEMVQLLSNRHLGLEKYQNQLVLRAALSRQETAIEPSLRNAKQDASYPAWTDLYARDVVSLQSYAAGTRLARALVDAMPPKYVSDPAFDFGMHETGVDLVAEVGRLDAAKRAELDRVTVELLGNFGAHSRNVVRGVLRLAAAP